MEPQPSGPDPALEELEEIARECAAECAIQAESELDLVNQALLAIQSILIAALDDWAQTRRRIVRPAEPADALPRDPAAAFLSLLPNISNGVLATRRLSQSGLNREARVVFRQVTEVADLALVFLGDAEFAAYYLRSPEEWKEADAHWKQRLKPSSVRSSLDKIESDLAAARGFAPSATRSSRWDLYQWLSKAAHVDLVALSVEGFAANAVGTYNLNLGGRFGPLTVSTLGHLAAYLDFFLDFLCVQLEKRHHWDSSHPALARSLADAKPFLARFREWESR